MKDLLMQLKESQSHLTKQEMESRGAILISMGIPFVSLGILVRVSAFWSTLLWGLGILLFVLGITYLAQMEETIDEDVD